MEFYEMGGKDDLNAPQLIEYYFQNIFVIFPKNFLRIREILLNLHILIIEARQLRDSNF